VSTIETSEETLARLDGHRVDDEWMVGVGVCSIYETEEFRLSFTDG
jgi:hypothetical protein